MKTYLELEEKLGPKPRLQPQIHLQQVQPQQSQPQPTQPSTNPMIRKAPGPKAADKRKRTVIAKRGYNVRVLAQPVPTTTPTPVNSTVPTPTVATMSTQMPVIRSTATSIPVIIYKLATGQFVEVPNLTARPQNRRHPSTQSSNPPPLEGILNAPIRQGTPWPNTGSASEKFIRNHKRLANSPYHSTYTCPHCENRSTTPGSSDPPGDGHTKASHREMLMGTTLPHLSE